MKLKAKADTLTTKEMRARVEVESVTEEIKNKYGFVKNPALQLEREITKLTKENEALEKELAGKLVDIQEQFKDLLELV